MINSVIRIASTVMIWNIICDLVFNKSITIYNMGTVLIVILVSLIFITIQFDELKHNKNGKE